MKIPDPLSVFIVSKESTCDGCEKDLPGQSLILLKENKEALCLSCAKIDHLVFLPAGDAALTRRAKKYSRQCAIVLKWAKRRKRYERQGLLVESEAIETARNECAADAVQRQRRQEKDAVRRAALDKDYIIRFAARVRKLYPHCPEGLETPIAEHACTKYSGRVGRSAAAKDLDPKSVRLAVIAHIRHTETSYDELLLNRINKKDARNMIRSTVDDILKRWENGPPGSHGLRPNENSSLFRKNVKTS